jgi:hypothetical protein
MSEGGARASSRLVLLASKCWLVLGSRLGAVQGALLCMMVLMHKREWVDVEVIGNDDSPQVTG